MGLGWYLAKIQAGEPVNPKTLMKQWRAAGLSESAFHAVLDLPQSKTGLFTIKNHDAFEDIARRFGVADNSSRINASITSNSHNVGVSGAMVIYRSLDHPHPDITLLTANGEPARNKSMKPYALLIENMENFLALDTITAFLVENTELSIDTLNQCEFIFSQGRAIQKKMTLNYLGRFQHTYWLPDLDAAGLDIYIGAQAVLGKHRTTLLYPSDLERRLRDAGKHITTDIRDTLKKLSDHSPELSRICTILINAEKTLEEEAYLAQY